jgi:hypothetical protein
MVRSPRKAISKPKPKEEVNPKPGINIANRRIEVRMGMTINLGDYQSQRVDLGFSGDIRDNEELEAKYDEMLTWIEDKLSAEADLIQKASPVLNKMRGK